VSKTREKEGGQGAVPVKQLLGKDVEKKTARDLSLYEEVGGGKRGKCPKALSTLALSSRPSAKKTLEESPGFERPEKGKKAYPRDGGSLKGTAVLGNGWGSEGDLLM